MVGAFLYLTVCSVRNRIRVRLRRLREPRYLVGLAVGLAYIGLVLTRYGGDLGQATPRGPAVMPAVASDRAVLEAVGAVGVFLTAVVAWLLPGTGRPALAFSRAEVQWLFTAPMTRRALLHYKIVRSLLGAILGSAIVTLVFRPGRVSAGWTFFAGMIVLMATMNLHLTGIAMRRASLRAHGRAAWARQWLPLGLLAAGAVVIIGALVVAWPALSGAAGPADLLAAVQQVVSSWPVRVVLWPFAALVALPLSGDAREFLLALPAAVGLFGLNYRWVLRSDTAVMEAAAANAAASVTSGRAGAVPAGLRRRAAPFVLGPVGRPEIAIVWKNLILAGRYATWGAVGRLLPVLVLLAFVVSQSARSIADALAVVCVLGVAGAMVIGPQVLRNDLRQDLAHIATLKAWPLTGAAILRGEVLAPTVILSTVVWACTVLAMTFATRATLDLDVSLAARTSYAVSAMAIAPAVILVQVVAQNGLVVLFPGWVDLGGARSRGMDVMGQRLLVVGALLLTVGVALVPALLVALVVQWGLLWLTGARLMVLPAIVVASVLVIECAVVLDALGRVFDRTDATAVPPEE